MLRDTSPPATRRSPAASPAVAGHRPLVLALAVAGCFGVAPVRAQPAGAQVVHGGAVLVQNGSSLTVTTQNGPGTQHSAINWQSFSVPAGSSTFFQQPGATSTSINRVVGPDPSSIYGRLGSNGRLVLVNPAGIAVGAGAVVDTAGFTASTLRMSEADAVAGRQRFTGDGTAGPLTVQGQVVARGGDIVLIAPKMEVGAQAVVESRGGATILAAGRSVEITGRGLEGIHFDVQAPSDQAVNLGTLKGDAVGIFAGTLRHSGLIQAQTATLEGGRVVLRALKDVEITPGAQVLAEGAPGKAGGSISVSSASGDVHVGTGALLSASGGEGAAGGAVRVAADLAAVKVAATITAVSKPVQAAPDLAAPLPPPSARGGRVEVVGKQVELNTGTVVDVSGDAEGGVILVGGDLHGANAAVMNALSTRVAPGVLLAADARRFGNGGRVVVWADVDTSFAGHVRARGGEQGGDGGFGETSGRYVLFFQGTADLGARRGRRGQLLLDPANITVANTADINGDGSTGDDIAAAGDLDNAAGDYPGANSRITGAALSSLLNSADVTLAATNAITVSGSIAKSAPVASTLTLDAASINFTNTASVVASVPGMGLTLQGSTSTALAGNFQGITLRSTGPVTFNSPTLDGVTIAGTVAAASGGALTIRNGLRLADGALFNMKTSTLYVAGSQAVAPAGTGTGTLRNEGGTVYVNAGAAGNDFTIAPGITVQGWGAFRDYYANGGLKNHGTLQANGAAGTTLAIYTSNFQTNNPSLIVNDGPGNLLVQPANQWINNGSIVNNGGTMTLVSGDQLNSSGTLALNAGTLTLGGSLSLDQLLGAGFSRNTGTAVTLTGTVDLGGQTVDIGSGGVFKTGGLTSLAGATLRNGTLTSGDGTTLKGYGTLDGMAVTGNLPLSGGGYLYLRNGLTLASGSTLDLANTTLYAVGTQALGVSGEGTATVRVAGNTTYVNVGNTSETLTLGAGLAYQGYGSVRNYYGDGRLVNDGTLAALGSGQTLYIDTSRFTNNGTSRSAGGTLYLAPGALTNAGALVNDGGVLTIAAVEALANAGELRLNAGRTNLGGSFTPAALASGYTRAAGSSVVLTGTLDLGNGTLDIGSAGLFQAGGLTAIEGGTVRNGTLRSGDGTPLAGYGTLDAMRLGTDVTMANGGYLTLRNGLTLADGVTFSLGNNTLYAVGTQAISVAPEGHATVQVAGNTTYVNVGNSSETLTLGSGLAYRGYGAVRNYYGDGGLVNAGTMIAEGSGQYLVVDPSRFTNDGVARSAGATLYLNPGSLANRGALVNDGGVLTLAAVQALDNTGTITLNAGTTNFGGLFGPDALASGYTRVAGSLVNLTGTLDLHDGALDIGSAGLFGTGGLSSLQGGTLKNGTVRSGDGTVLDGYGTLDAITINGNLTKANGGYLYLRNGLKLANGITFSTGNNGLYAVGSQSIAMEDGGAATLQTAGGTTYVNVGNTAETLTIASGVTYRGYGAIRNYYGDGRLVINGTVSAEGSNQTLVLDPSRLTNTGALRSAGATLYLDVPHFDNTGRLANDGGVLNIANAGAVDNTGTIALGAGTTYLGGSFTLPASVLRYTRAAGTQVVLTGTLDLGGARLDVGSAGAFKTGGLTSVQGGTLKNGTIASGDGTPLDGYGTLDGIATGSDLAITGGNYFYVRGGLVLADGTTLSKGSTSFYMRGTQAIATASGGSATVRSTGGWVYVNIDNAGDTLTIGPGVAVRGYTGFGDYYGNGGLVNNGTIASEGSTGGWIWLDTTRFTNNGRLDVGAGTTMYRQADFTNPAGATVSGSGTFYLGSDKTLTNLGTLAPGSAATTGLLTIVGNLDTSAGTVALRTGSTGAYDAIRVSGSVGIGSGMTVARSDAAGASYVAGDAFDVLRSDAGSVTGSLPTVTGFTVSVTPSPAPVSLRLVAQSPAPTAAPTATPPPPTAAPTPAPTTTPAPSPSPTPAPPAPTPSPPPAPTPAPPPPPATQADRIVEAMQGEATVAQAQESLVVMDGTVTKALEDVPATTDPKKRDRSQPADDGKTCR